MRLLALVLALLAVPACVPADDAAPADTESGLAPLVPAPPDTSPTALADHLPADLAGRPRQLLDVSVDSALGAEVVQASARYGEPAEVTLTLTDFKTDEMTQMMGYGWGREPGADTLEGYPVQRDSAAHSYAVRVLIGDHRLVEATAATRQEAETALAALDLAGLGRDG